MRNRLLAISFAAACAVPMLLPSAASAEGCYTCGSGSSAACKDYCRYAADTFEARKACEQRGCKVSGTGSCPTAVNYKVCLAPAQKSDITALAIAWCAAAPRS